MAEENTATNLIFLFPFTFNSTKDLPLEEELGNWERVWEKNPRELPRLRLNEHQYFYPATYAALYDGGNHDHLEKYREYRYKKTSHGGKSQYIITPQAKKNEKEAPEPYKLDINCIGLKLYGQAGKVGLLYYKLHYEETQPLEDIIKICEYGRRIFFPYIQGPDEKEPRPGQVAESLEILHADGSGIKEDFASAYTLKTGQSGHGDPTFISKTVTELLGKCIQCVKPVLDDRMFVMLLYKNQALIDGLRDETDEEASFHTESFRHYFVKKACEAKDEPRMVMSQRPALDDWYKLMFVDVGSPTFLNRAGRLEAIKKASYSRWIGGGTLYGFTNYSYVMLGTEGTDETNGMPPYLIEHFSTMYFQMVALALAQRAHLLYFSGRISELSQDLTDGERRKRKRARNRVPKLLNGPLEFSRNRMDYFIHGFIPRERACNEVPQLQASYARFLSQIYHEEVTAQDQGIEMYDKLQATLFIPKYMGATEKQLDRLGEYARGHTEAISGFLLAVVAIASLIGGGFQVLSAVPTLVDCGVALWSGRILVYIGIFALLAYIAWHVVRKHKS
ncbi:MAG: hypothetical protein LBU47_03165 [Christensenellaceae bacterium]|jgi:hypothetical protein|nr:hypothetical protein [Christensenellaceae bacterium]